MRRILPFIMVMLSFLWCSCENESKKTQNDTGGGDADTSVGDEEVTDTTTSDEMVTDDTSFTCGNGTTDPGEACDGDAKECSEINSTYIVGWASCKSDCSGYDISTCSMAPDADVDPDNGSADTDVTETDDEPAMPDDDASATLDVFALGPYQVLQKDLAKNAAGNAMAVRIYYPNAAGTYPYVNFIHGFQLKNTYYDQILTHLASHGFIIVSIQFEQSLLGGDTTIQEAEKMMTMLDGWITPQLGTHTAPAVPDFTKVGLSGHSRGGKTSWRMILTNPNRFQAIAGVDPVLAPPPMGSDPNPITGPVNYAAPSLLIGTELGPTGMQACAPSNGNSAYMYPYLPSPTWHLIGAGVGHMDMIDADDLSSCGMTCSVCAGGDNNQKATFRTLTGGLLVAFFRASLSGETALYSKLTDTVSMPHPVSKEEHK